MVLQHDMKLSTGYTNSGASQEVQAKVDCCLCSAWANQLELQNNLQMAATCGDLEVSWRWLPRRSQAVNHIQMLLVLA